MFITKKRFAREIAKAKREVKEEIRKEERMKNMVEDIHHSMDCLAKETFTRIDRLEEKFARMEHIYKKIEEEGASHGKL